MEDKIQNVDKETLYKFLDKIANKLSTEDIGTNSAFSLHRQGTYNGMKIKIFTKQKTVIIDSDIRNNVINLHITQDGSDNYNFATLYKDNSVSCKNFLKQIEIEDKKIQTLLSDMLKELESLDKPVKVENVEKQKVKTRFNKMLDSLRNWYYN